MYTSYGNGLRKDRCCKLGTREEEQGVQGYSLFSTGLHIARASTRIVYSLRNPFP